MTSNKNCLTVTRVILLAGGLLLGVLLCFGGVDPAAQQLLAASVQQMDIFTADAAPFHIEADLRIQNQVPTEGHLSFRWESKDRFWRRIISDHHQQIDIKKGESVFLSRNAPFTPLRVTELISLLAMPADPDRMQIKK